MKLPAMILDIDGTLADCEHRRHHVTGKPKDWPAFFAAMMDDPVKKLVADTAKSIAAQKKLQMLFVTGRYEEYRETTATWLHLAMGVTGPLYMRPDGDSVQDDILKKRIYETVIAPTFDVKLVLDDRTRVVAMWRSLGLECWQVAAGDF